MTKVITFANRKGGAGKSTCAAHFAIEAVREGYKVLLVDLDAQKSLEKWWERRSEDNPYCADVRPAALKEKIEAVSKSGFDLCIIDTPGDTSAATHSGIEVADVIVIPTKPTATDLAAIGRTIQMVKDTAKKFVFIVTQTTQRTRAPLQAISILSEYGPVAPASLTNRVSYGEAMGTGQSARDTDKAAAQELGDIWAFIKDKVIENGKKHGKEKI